MKMFRIDYSICIFVLACLLAPSTAAVCPNSCVCSTTRDGLHRATCSNLAELYKFTMRQNHHNINILDLSHNNITKLAHELDRLTEVVTLDLSTNGITDVNKFLHNAKKLVHLNLANNRIENLHLIHLPISVSSLDLTNNLLKNVPSDFEHLFGLEHFELEGNPLNCSCENILTRDRLINSNVFIDNAKCVSPSKLRNKSWLEIKTKDVCGKVPPTAVNYLDMMMGDQPSDAERIGEETTALKSMSLVASSDLEDGNIIQEKSIAEDEDSLQFMKVGHATSKPPLHDIEGSGEAESTTIFDIEPLHSRTLYNDILINEEILPNNNVSDVKDIIEGSGEGSGMIYYDEHEAIPVETTTPVYEEFSPEPVHTLFDDEVNDNEEFPLHIPPTVFEGRSDWYRQSDPITEIPVTEKPFTIQIVRDTTVSEPIRVTQTAEVLGESSDVKQTPHKTGTYVCIAIIVVLLVGLVGFAIGKSQIRKKRDRRLIRQQKPDVERASKEMVDMNKSLLGKPAVLDSPVEKKANGKYELVPTHEKIENLGNGIGNGHSDSNAIRTSSRDTNQNRSGSKDNNLSGNPTYTQDNSFDSAPDSRKDLHSLSSEDVFVPLNGDDTLRLNGAESEISHPLINGDHSDLDYLSPSREYVPVYSPDMGRVRIKMSETPKPKTPVLVTRSRSNAGDMIITPSLGGAENKTNT